MNQKSLLHITDPDAEIRSMRIESTSIYPQTINYSAYGGGALLYYLQKGLLLVMLPSFYLQ